MAWGVVNGAWGVLVGHEAWGSKASVETCECLDRQMRSRRDGLFKLREIFKLFYGRICCLGYKSVC